MKSESKPDVTLEALAEEEFDDEQYETSSEAAHKFIDRVVIPAVHQFDYDNEDEEYIPGIASFALFCRMISELGAQGYTEEELVEQIQYYIHLEEYRTIN